MRSRIAEIIILAPLVVLALVGAPSIADAQRIIDLGVDTVRIPELPDAQDVEIQVGAGSDSVARVIIRGGDRRQVRIRGSRDRGEDNAAVVRTGEDVTIEKNQIAEGDVVAIGGSVNVLGQVLGDAVAVGGDVDLREGASVTGDAVAIGGKVRKAPGSHLGGQEVGMNFIPAGFLRAPHRQAASLFKFSALLVLGLFLFLLGWLSYALAERRMETMGTFFLDHPWKSLLTGLAVVLLLPVAFVILCVTIVGIPVALLTLFAGPLAHAIGFLLVAASAGRRLLSRGHGGAGWGWMRSLASGLGLFLGIVFLGEVFRFLGAFLAPFGWVLTIFGWTVIFLASTVGLGTLVLSRFGSTRQPQALVPPPPPSPVTAPASPA